MNYIVSEEELADKICDVENKFRKGLSACQIAKNILKSKTPVEVIASGIVKIRSGNFISLPSIGESEWATIPDKLIKRDNKKIKLMVVEYE